MAIACVGAGFSGAVIARRLAQAGQRVAVFESRPHVGGNCHTARDPQTGVMAHVYGPHIFHTDDAGVWSFVNGFGEMVPYVNRVKAVTGGRVYSLPINLLTINQFFGKVMRPDEARRFVASRSEPRPDPATFEEQALSMVGRELYSAFLEGYTRKQWGIPPSQLPASVLKRLPVRFNYDDNYYSHRYQGIPRDGYTALVERMLDHPGISLHLNTKIAPDAARDFAHVFYSGPLDEWFQRRLGPLAYRTLDFTALRARGDYQGTAVVNYCDSSVPYTRVTEHKHFAPWEDHSATLCFEEVSRACGEADIPYYPIRLVQDRDQLGRYAALARREPNVTFVGRLGTYRYLDMDVTVKEALDTADIYLDHARRGSPMPAFAVPPLPADNPVAAGKAAG